MNRRMPHSQEATPPVSPPAPPLPLRRIHRRYTIPDLRAIWDFVKHDFDGFLELLIWLEDLKDKDADEQVRAARDLALRANASSPLDRSNTGD